MNEMIAEMSVYAQKIKFCKSVLVKFTRGILSELIKVKQKPRTKRKLNKTKKHTFL